MRAASRADAGAAEADDIREAYPSLMPHHGPRPSPVARASGRRQGGRSSCRCGGANMSSRAG
jgi:hypothetical protein